MEILISWGLHVMGGFIAFIVVEKLKDWWRNPE
jgi:hypothetical protein